MCEWNVIYTHCRSSTRPTFIGGSPILFLSLLRCCFLYEPLKYYLNFNFIHTESRYLCFLIGVAIAAECSFSIMCYWFQLQFSMAVKQCRITLRCWRNLILALSLISFANAVWLFIRVCDLWVQHMYMIVQMFHSVPSLLLILHSLMQGSVCTYLHVLLHMLSIGVRLLLACIHSR